MIASGMEVPVPIPFVARYSYDAVERVFRCMPFPEFSTTLSLVKNSVTIDGQENLLLRFTRTRVKECIYRTYVEKFGSNERVQFESFLKILTSLTSFDKRVRKAVDYASGILLYDILDVLSGVVDRADVIVRRNPHSFVDWQHRFMKFEYGEHIGTTEAATHDFAFAFDKTSAQVPLRPGFTQCRKPFQIIQAVQG